MDIGIEEENGTLLGKQRKTTRALKVVALVASILAILFFVLFLTKKPTQEASQPHPSTCQRQPAGGNTVMVASTSTYATAAALEMLNKGGTAADAAAAAQFMYGLVLPSSTGIGGGCFIVLYNATTKQVVALDAREEAPELMTSRSFCVNETCETDPNCECPAVFPYDQALIGGRSAGVPGVISAMRKLVRDHGKLTLKDAAAPSIKLAREGFPMSQHVYNLLTKPGNAYKLGLFNASRNLYLPITSPEGGYLPIPVGEIFKNLDLANTYEIIANEDLYNDSAVSFYHGEIARDIAAAAQAAKEPISGRAGLMQESDLASYRAVYREAVQSTYRNFTLWGMPPPSSGALSIGMMLNVLENFDVGSMKPQETEWLARYMDTQNVIFADRNMYMADADFVQVPQHSLLNKSYASSRAAMFKALTSLSSVYGGGSNSIPFGIPAYDTRDPQSPEDFVNELKTAPSTKEEGTNHMTIVDQWGNIVSMTTTIESEFGCGVVVPGRGFLLNNELTDFSTSPFNTKTGGLFANRPEGRRAIRRTALGEDSTSIGGKRPRSSMSPAIIFNSDGTPFFASGSPGGSTIISSVASSILNVIDFGMCVTDAVDAPRVSCTQAGGTCGMHPELYNNTKLVKDLLQRGYPLTEVSYLGYVEAIRFFRQGENDNLYEGAADLRIPGSLAQGY